MISSTLVWTIRSIFALQAAECRAAKVQRGTLNSTSLASERCGIGRKTRRLDSLDSTTHDSSTHSTTPRSKTDDRTRRREIYLYYRTVLPATEATYTLHEVPVLAVVALPTSTVADGVHVRVSATLRIKFSLTYYRY